MIKALFIVGTLILSSNCMADLDSEEYIKPTNKFIITSNGILINTNAIGVFDGTTLILIDGTKIPLKEAVNNIEEFIYNAQECNQKHQLSC